MGRYERAAKSSLKEATALASGIIDSVRQDLEEEARLEGEMRDRVESIQGILNEVASIQMQLLPVLLRLNENWKKQGRD